LDDFKESSEEEQSVNKSQDVLIDELTNSEPTDNLT
jgi:hypothetical protein